MRRTAFVVMLVIVLLVGAAPTEPAHAYSLGGHRFNPPTGYWATGAVYPSGWVTAALNASNAWTNVTDCDFSWVRNQAAGQAWGNYVTSYNKGADGRPGLTVYSYNGTTIFNLRVNLNTYYPFGTTGPSSMWYDVQNVLTHEFGHGLVLGHSGVSTATMYNYTSKGETLKRTLAADDIAGIQALY